MADPDLHSYVLANHGDLLTPAERAAETLSTLRRKVERGGDRSTRRMLDERRHAAPEGAQALSVLDTDARDLRIAERILTEHAVEVWPNRCPRCDGLCRTALARRCPACGHGWPGTPRYHWRIERASPRPERRADLAFCHLVPDVGVLACVADGAGNSAAGICAAEHVLARVRAWAWTAGTDAWTLQERLFVLDAELTGSGGESTAALALFGADGEVRAAVAGDTRILAVSGPDEIVSPRSPRLGTGVASPIALNFRAAGVVRIATDGAWAGGASALEDALRAPGNDWIETRARQTGDDATLVTIAREP